MAEGTARAKALRQEHPQYEEIAKRPMWPKQSERKRKGIREIGKCNHFGFTLREPRREWQDLITNVKEAG